MGKMERQDTGYTNSLMVLLILRFYLRCLNWKKFAKWKKYCIFIYFIFFFLSTE